jgi:histidine triad (HIT) family protein
MTDCIFCKIIAGDIPSEKIIETDKVIAFKDLYPQAKEHYLFIHKKHTKNINEISLNQPDQFAEVYSEIQKFCSSNELEQNGFRVVSNVNAHGGQTVFHTHFHVLGGEQLGSFGR